MASEASFSVFVYTCLIWLFLGFAVVSILLLIDFLRITHPWKKPTLKQ